MRKSTFSKAHKLIASLMVACMLVACLPLSLIASAYQLNADTVLADVDFDENNIVMQFGVLTDQHLSYQYDSAASITNKTQRYANIVATLNKLAGNKLQGILNCGDYTSHGNAYQAETFASATKVIFDAINADAAETGITTKFMFTYGNHDTSWGSMMPISHYAFDYQGIADNHNNYYQFANTSVSGKSDTWEELLDEYGLLHDQGAISWDDIDGDGEDDYLEGSYLYSITAENGQVYYFIGLETITYANNGYAESTLKWLDKKLAEITAADPDAYVYIGSHAPVAGSNVFGSNIELDQNADWAATDNDTLYNVLKKYPQVVYFSGHTHYNTMLETSIMSNTYTAITVATIHENGLFSASGSGYNYDAASGNIKNTGFGLLVQVDANGNQKITRVIVPDQNTQLMNLSGTANSYNVTNAGDFNQVIFNSATLNTEALDAYEVTTWGDAYLMPAPDAENNHLRYYSAQRGEGANIAFDEGDTVTLSNAVFSNTNGLSATVAFDTATADKNILQYRVTFKKANGTELKTEWFIGNWCDILSGVANGTNHMNATKLSYIVNNISSTNTSIYAEVVAVDEFGNMSEPIKSNLIDLATVQVSLEKPEYDEKYEAGTNWFDKIGASSIVEYTNANNDVVVDTTNGLTVNVTTMGNDAIHYNFTGAGYTKTWGMMTANAHNVTGLSPDETMVYEGTYNFSLLGANTYIVFRAVEGATVGGQYWNEHQSGLMFNANGTYLMLNNATVATNTSYKLTLNTDHVVKIVTAKDTVSVWIDDTCVFDNVNYTLEGRAVANDGSVDKCPVETYPYYYNGVYLKSKNLYPTVGVFVNGTADSETNSVTFTVKDQKYYHYYINDRTDYIVQNNSIPGANELTFAGNLNFSVDASATSIFTPSANGFVFDLSQAGYDKIGQTNVNSDYYVYPFGYNVYPFGTNDTWTFEYDLTANNFISTGDPRVKFTLGYVTTASGVKKDVTIMMQGATQYIMNASTWQSIANTGVAWNAEGATAHFKYTVNGNKSIDFEISNATKKYTYTYDLEVVFGAGYTFEPAVSLSYKKATMTASNVNVTCNKAMENVTVPTESNNLVGNITTGMAENSDGKIISNNLFSDTTWQTLKEHNFTNYYANKTVNLFGGIVPVGKYDSYAISFVARTANSSLKPVVEGTDWDGSKSVVSRLGVEIGKYNGEWVYIYIDDTKMNFTDGTASVNLATKYGYAVGDYYRLTILVNPYGYEVYFNGKLAATSTFAKPELMDYSSLQIYTGGSVVSLRDISVWLNLKAGDTYYNKINSQVDYVDSAYGVLFDDAAKAQANVVKNALAAYKAAGVNDYTTLKPYVNTLNEVVASGTINNNLVADGTTIVGSTASKIFDHTGDEDWKYGNLVLFNGDSPFTPADDFIVEADLSFTDVWYNTRIGFALNNVADGDVMLQHNTQFVNTQASSWNTGYATTNGTRPTAKNTANKWHVKYIVKGGESIQTVITDSETGELLHDYTAPWDVLRTASTNKEYFSPVLYFACCSVELKNIYVGYDVTEAKDALNATVSEYATKDTEGFSAESVKAFTDALANANKILGEYRQYSNAQINAAEEAIIDTYALLEKASVDVEIGDESVEIDPSDLPVNVRPEGSTKYILGWLNPDGSVYEGTTYVEGLVAEYVETKMMTVKYQLGTSGDSIRYIASIDSAERYNSVGWVFSISNTNPELGAAGVVEKNSTKVYRSILANGEEKTTADIYGEVDYSQYLYVFQITGIPEAQADTTIYVRPYVEMADGRIVYGDVSAQTLNGLKTR